MADASNSSNVMKDLESKKLTTKTGVEYWSGRELQLVLGYARWEPFQGIVEKGKMACESAGVDPANHFREVTQMVVIGSGASRPVADMYITRYGCYLTAMNGDTSKLQVAEAQSYFAVQTRRQEIQDQLTDQDRRLQLRERIKSANMALNSAAKRSGVSRYDIFHNAGYQGLYGLSLSEIKHLKGIDGEDLLDRAGRAELAANEFRITQTEAKLIRENVSGEMEAVQTHKAVGSHVRETIQKLGGTMPEKLAPRAVDQENTQSKEIRPKIDGEIGERVDPT